MSVIWRWIFAWHVRLCNDHLSFFTTSSLLTLEIWWRLPELRLHLHSSKNHDVSITVSDKMGDSDINVTCAKQFFWSQVNSKSHNAATCSISPLLSPLVYMGRNALHVLLIGNAYKCQLDYMWCDLLSRCYQIHNSANFNLRIPHIPDITARQGYTTHSVSWFEFYTFISLHSLTQSSDKYTTVLVGNGAAFNHTLTAAIETRQLQWPIASAAERAHE